MKEVMLTIVLAEAALETIPKQLWKHRSVTKHSRSRDKTPGEMLLDRSFHHSSMMGIQNAERRGRPDLVHLSLLNTVSTPLYRADQVKIIVHTVTNKVIILGRSVRLPKSYFRFEGLMEKLFMDGRDNNTLSDLLELRTSSFSALINTIKPSQTIGLSRVAKNSTAQEVARRLSEHKDSLLVVGGFPRGHFSGSVKSSLDDLYSIHRMPLDTNVVLGRVIYEYEKEVGISH